MTMTTVLLVSKKIQRKKNKERVRKIWKGKGKG